MKFETLKKTFQFKSVVWGPKFVFPLGRTSRAPVSFWLLCFVYFAFSPALQTFSG